MKELLDRLKNLFVSKNRHKRRWTSAELITLKSMLVQDKKYSTMARKLGRTTDAIRQKIRNLK